MGVPVGAFALDTKTGLRCKTYALDFLEFGLSTCIALYERYPDDKAEIKEVQQDIARDKQGFKAANETPDAGHRSPAKDNRPPLSSFERR
jgi:hypothetical protein